MKSNIIIQFNKVAWVKLFYQSRCNNFFRKKKPSRPTVHGEYIESGYAAEHQDYPAETMLERARRLDIIDEWIPRLVIAFSATKHLYFEGQQAEKYYAAFQNYMFKRMRKMEEG